MHLYLKGRTTDTGRFRTAGPFGNGSFNGDVGGRNFGNSFIKVSPDGTLLDWFTPYNWSFLNATDEDLGIQNALLIPNTNLIVGGGKEGVMYVVDRTNMGHFRTGKLAIITTTARALTH